MSLPKSMANKAGQPAIDGDNITKSDSAELAHWDAVYVGTGGDITLLTFAGHSPVFKNYPSGSFLPFVPKKIMSTGTTASDFVGVKR